MISVLVDHNIEGQARLIWNAVPLEEWAAFQIDRFYELPEVGIAPSASDREIYAFLQIQPMLLLTGNRNSKGPDALEVVLKENASFQALPVITIADVERVIVDSQYRFECATRLQEIAWLIDIYRAVPRLYIP